jgi:hypothetical protein
MLAVAGLNAGKLVTAVHVLPPSVVMAAEPVLLTVIATVSLDAMLRHLPVATGELVLLVKAVNSPDEYEPWIAMLLPESPRTATTSPENVPNGGGGIPIPRIVLVDTAVIRGILC